MIEINNKIDPRISEHFPNDPDYNLCIITATQKLNLQQAFLSMDSQYFSSIDPDTRQINLAHLAEQPLIRVIRALYGQELVVQSISELNEVYPIILELGIEDYINNIRQQIGSKKELMESLQFLEFSFKYDLFKKEVIQIHMQNKLKSLEESKNYLQLIKISRNTFNTIILEFVNRNGLKESKIVNNVMENYFNRHGIKAMEYLNGSELAKLQGIWLKYHHVYLSQMYTPKSTPTISAEQENRSRKRTEIVGVAKRQNQTESLEMKRKKVKELEIEIFAKDNLIYELTHQIQKIKQELQAKGESDKPKQYINIDNDQDEMSFVESMKRNKKSQELNQSTSKNDLRISQYGFQNANIAKRVIPETKQFKSISKLAKNTKLF